MSKPVVSVEEPVDLGMMMHQRDRKRASQLFRTQSLGKAPTREDDSEQLLGNFEPDWTKFENVFAKGNQ